MNSVLLIHRARTPGSTTLEPVGIWEIDENRQVSFYPPGNEKYEARGDKAMHDHPPISAIQWALHKAHTSANWRVYHPAPSSMLFDVDPDVSLAQIFASVHAEYRKTAASKQEHIRMVQQHRGSSESSSDEDRWREVLAQSWWIAAELVRRHPELTTYEMHPGGGTYDVLAVSSPQRFSPNADLSEPVAMLNRAGTLQVHAGDQTVVVADWRGIRGRAARFAALRALEDIAGWDPPEETPVATSRSLCFRFVAAALELFVHDGMLWDARCESLDTADWPADDPGLIELFPSALEDVRTIERLGIHGEPLSHFWALLRGEKPVLMLSMDGRAYTQKGATLDLMVEYEKGGRRVRRMAASVLRQWL